MYVEWGILKGSRWPRSLADMSRFPNEGNGMLPGHNLRRRGVDPYKNESGMAGTHSLFESRRREVSAGKGSRAKATNSFHSELGTSQRSIAHTRSQCSSAAITLSVPSCGKKSLRCCTMIGKVVGQISSIFFTDLVFIQRRCKSRRRGDAYTMLRQLRHTCVRVGHRGTDF